MKENKGLVCGICLGLLLFLFGFAGCSLQPECKHDNKVFREAVESDFLREGSIAHYQCRDCGTLFDLQNAETDSVAVPVLSPELVVCVNGESAALVLQDRNPNSLIWTAEDLTAAQGDAVTVCDAADTNKVYAYQAQGDIDDAGVITEAGSSARVSLQATKDALVLTVTVEKYPGLVAQINGRQYPLEKIACMWLEAGDSLAFVDNARQFTYGYDDRLEEQYWNVYDYHRGEDGAFVIDQPAKYLLEMTGEEEKRVSLTKVCGHEEVSDLQILFRDQETVPMEKLSHGAGSALFAQAQLLLSGETGSSVPSYGAVVRLEAGTMFQLGNEKTRLTAQRLTQVTGGVELVAVEDQWIRIRQPGVYLVRYLPWCGSIQLEYLSDGEIQDAAFAFDKQILSVPSYQELYHSEKIKALYAQYADLPGGFKALLRIPQKLETMYRTVLLLEEKNAPVTYMLSNGEVRQVYRSREELKNAFFSDFYYYILTYHGTKQLLRYEVETVEDFLDVAGDLEGAGMTDLSGIGHVAKTYLLTTQSNGILENQNEKGFLGFCYQNGLYSDVIPFLIRFFAYWRLDERFADKTNNAADFFVETWAPVVDTAKLFYYDETTSPVQTKRVLDCMTNSAAVVYGLDDGDLPQIRLRGYIFEGWYTDADCSGEPVTKLGSEPITLYAKWGIDTAQQDRDGAALVDVYIYNLTTDRARRNATTVGYVADMYEALSENAKGLVQEIKALERMIKLFADADA